MTTQPRANLSPDLTARKAEILAGLQTAMRRRAARRRAVRAAFPVLMLAVAAPAAYLLLPSAPAAKPTPLASADTLPAPAAPVTAVAVPAAPRFASIRVSEVSNSPAIVERLTVTTEPSSIASITQPQPLTFIQLLSDDQLLQELAAAGRPSGLLRTPRATLLLSNAPPSQSVAPRQPADPPGGLDLPGIRGI